MEPRPLRGRGRLSPLAVAAGAIGSALLGLGVASTHSALTATVINASNVTGAGSIVMSETSASGTGSCTSTSGANNSAVCSTYNTYGGSTSLTPGSGTSGSTVRIYSTGSLTPSSFTLTPGACSISSNPKSSSGNICQQFKLSLSCTVTSNGLPAAPVAVYGGSTTTLSSIASAAVDLKAAKACLPPNGAVGGGSYTTFTFSVQLAAGTGNEVQGQTASQDLVWRFST